MRRRNKDKKYRKLGEVAIDLSGLSDKGKITILKAIAKDEEQERKK